MAQALYRRYRPRKLTDVVGQDHIIKTLTKAIKDGRISHAYLFSGPRGVGKTSVARILAHEVNNLPYKDEAFHLDIIEIDGASNRRIDEIRDLRDKVNIAPTAAKYKVYIIDEVHMLTKEAFNALLKTLEEPPAHCIFILATTEPHKLPDTIISRTQRFSFSPIENQITSKHLKSIAKKESIDIDDEALAVLAEFGEGSFRDSLSLLDQLAAIPGVITADKVNQLIGLPPRQTIEKVLAALEEGNVQQTLELAAEVRHKAYDPSLLARQLSLEIRRHLAEGLEFKHIKPANLLKELLEVAAAKQPHEMLEVALIEAAADGEKSGALKRQEPTSQLPAMPESTSTTTPKPAETSSVARVKADSEIWPKLLETAKAGPSGLHAALRLAKPSLEKNKLTLNFEFPLHMNKVKSAENLRYLKQTLNDLSGRNIDIETAIDASKPPAETTKSAPASKPERSDELETINNIFGSAEVLES